MENWHNSDFLGLAVVDAAAALQPIAASVASIALTRQHACRENVVDSVIFNIANVIPDKTKEGAVSWLKH